MAKFAEIQSLNSKIEKGAWVDNLPNLAGYGIKFRVRGYGNSDHRKLMGELYSDLSEEERSKPEVEFAIHTELITKTILLEWTGMDDFPFNPKNVKIALTDPSVAILRTAIDFASKTVGQSGQEKLESAVKK
jgi:hypothetical protein